MTITFDSFPWAIITCFAIFFIGLGMVIDSYVSSDEKKIDVKK